MQDKMKIIMSSLVAILMVACVVPVSVTDDSDALTGNSTGMALDKDSSVIYVTGGTTSVPLSIDTVPTGADPDFFEWSVNSLEDDNTHVDYVSLSTTSGSSTIVSALTVNNRSVATVEVIASDGTNYASAVIVIYPSPSTTATTFHYYLKVDTSAIPSGVTPQTSYGTGCPISYSDITTGIWIEVSQSQYNGTDPWNAMSAFQWYCDTYGISCHASGGWISDIINLSTYSGNNGIWYYWAQYHATTTVVNNQTVNTWAFNNTTMSYITSVDSSYIGLIFWGSPNANTMPTFPGYPEASV